MSRARDIADGKFANDLTVDTNTLFVDSTNNKVSIGKTGPSYKTEISDGTVTFGVNPLSAYSTAYVGTTTNHAMNLITNGNTRATLLAGGGLTFNGDTAAANALNDFEFGTWTANINFGSNTGSSTGATYSNTLGNYVKIGNLVHVQCRITFTAKGSSTGNANITGIPFTSNGGGTPIVPMSCWYSGFTGVTRGQVIIGRIDNNSSGIELRFLDGNNEAVLNDTHLTNTSNVAIGGTYYTTQ
jgi:hypothetical protein